MFTKRDIFKIFDQNRNLSTILTKNKFFRQICPNLRFFDNFHQNRYYRKFDQNRDFQKFLTKIDIFANCDQIDIFRKC